MIEFWQNVAREQIGLGGVGIARQDERLDPHRAVAFELGEHLVGIADDRRPAARTRTPDARPQVGLGIAVVGRALAQRGLCGDAGRGRVERLGADFGALAGIELGEQPVGGGARLRLGVAHDDMRAVAIAQRAAVFGSARGHVSDDRGDRLGLVGPHQEDVAALRRRLACILGQAAEIERRRLARDGADARRIELELPELAVMVEALAVQHRLEDLHRLDGAAVARARRQHLAGQIGRDDVDRQPPAEQPVDRRDLARELRRPASRRSRTAISSAMRRSIGAIAAAKAVVSMPRL